VEPLAGWVLRQNGRAVPLAPKALLDAVADGVARLREAHEGPEISPARERRVDAAGDRGERPVGPIAPERFGVLQALLAHLLSACGEKREAHLEADDLAERFSIPREELQDTLSLLNLVNFGGGCYTVYAEVDEDTGDVRVDKELYGDVFRKPPKLTPLEARAISLAIDYVGPTIAADAGTPLDRVRHKLEETFGQFDVPHAPAGSAGDAEEQLVRTLSDAVEKHRVVEIEYLKEGEERPTMRSVEPYTFERELPFWRVHTWDRTAGGSRTYRLDRMRSARLTDEEFEPRPGFDPNYLREPRTARLWHSPLVARWKLERGARSLTDKAAISDLPYKTDEWLLSEVLADAGETVVLEPAEARAMVAARAKALQQELGVSARRKRPAARA
jgi:proteasome accessory factor C